MRSKAKTKVQDRPEAFLAQVFLLNKRRAPGDLFGGQTTKSEPHRVFRAKNSWEIL